MSDAAKIIKYIRKQIPSFQCKPGCHDCCNDLIIFSPWEWGQIKDKRIATDVQCPYLGAGGCEIYEQRPIICRLFGAIRRQGLTCDHGCGPSKPLSASKEIELCLMYTRLLSQDIYADLDRSADLNKIVEIVRSGDGEYTDFVRRLGGRLEMRATGVR